jgi:hypothetical protein
MRPPRILHLPENVPVRDRRGLFLKLRGRVLQVGGVVQKKKITSKRIMAAHPVTSVVRVLSSLLSPLLTPSLRQTLYLWAAGQGYEELVDILLNQGTGLESKSNSGQTALSRAAGI